MSCPNDIKIAYILGIFVWIITIILFRLYETDLIGYFILIVPIIIFIYNIYTDTTDGIKTYNINLANISIALLVTVGLIGTVDHNKEFTKLIVGIATFTLLSLVYVNN